MEFPRRIRVRSLSFPWKVLPAILEMLLLDKSMSVRIRRFRNAFSCTFSIPQFVRDIFCRFTSPAILNTSFSSLFMKLPFKFNTCTSGEIPLGTVVKSFEAQSAVFFPPVHLQRHFLGQLFVKSASDSGNNVVKRSSSGKKESSGKELISPPERHRLKRRCVTDGPGL